MGLLTGDLSQDRAWWREGTVYQIFIHSFKDSSGDGIGDLNGVTAKLDYLYQLGVDIIQLSPIYDSPLVDMGYDVRCHTKILDVYGTMDDWKKLLDEVHKRRMRLIMDLSPGWTVYLSQHAFFQESCSSKDNPKHDWYIWKDPKFNEQGERIPPNNWEAVHGGPAWTWDERRGQYYHHIFAPAMPDLNWDNPAVRNATYDVMRFWLDQGVDGFRIGVINCISKAHGLPDAPITNPGSSVQPAGMFYLDGPNVHHYLQEMNQNVLKDYDVMIVGDMSGNLDFYEALKYVAKERKELSMVFHFAHMQIDQGPKGKWDIRKYKLTEFKDKIHMWQQYMTGSHGWNSIFFENHDHPRSTVRFLTEDPKYRAISAKMLATLQFSLTGTPFLYQGQELAITHPKGWEIDDYKDIETRNFFESERENHGLVKDVIDDVMYKIQRKARDNARTPMQWNASKSGGFTDGNNEPWLKLNEDYRDWNVEQQMNDPDSVWNYYKTMILIRKCQPSLSYGSFIPLDAENEKIFAYVRAQGNFGSLTILNWSPELNWWTVPEEIGIEASTLVVGNYPRTGRHLCRDLDLQPFEARIYTIIDTDG